MQWLTKNLFVRQFQILQKIKSKLQILKLLKDQKILKNYMIHYLEIIETKQIYMTKKYKNIRKRLGYIQKNNPWL